MIYNERLTASDCFGLTKSVASLSEPRFEELNISDLKITGKTIIVLCGNNTKNPLRAAAYAQHCFNWAGVEPDNPDVLAYSIYYPKSQPLLNLSTPNPNFDYDGLAHLVFDQLTVADGKPLSAEEISNNLSKITFFGHSIGGFVMNELMSHLDKFMQEYNFSDADKQKVFSSIVFIGYSPYRFVSAPINGVYITPIYDSVGSIKLTYDKFKDSDDVASSINNLTVKNIFNSKDTSCINFVRQYKSATQDSDTLYLADNITLVAAPNLLYYDGIREDHNLAGVVNYTAPNPYKTTAGIITTKFLDQVFNYSLTTPREDFSVPELFAQAVKLSKSITESNDTNKEL